MKLDPDYGVLIAVERAISGSNAHSLRGLANAYVLAIENGKECRAEEYKLRLIRALWENKIRDRYH